MSIKYFENDRVFTVNTENSTYAFCINDDNSITNLHWGAKVDNAFDLMTVDEVREPCEWKDSDYVKRGEFTAWGGKFFDEPCLKVTFGDGVRDCKLGYVGHKLSNDGLELVLTVKDVYYNFYVDLYYKVYPGLDLIDKKCVIRNEEDTPVTIEAAMSGSLYLPKNEYMLTVMGSAWAREYDLKREKLSYGKTVIESRTLYSNSNYLPYFACNLVNVFRVDRDLQNRSIFGKSDILGTRKLRLQFAQNALGIPRGFAFYQIIIFQYEYLFLFSVCILKRRKNSVYGGFTAYN